MARRTRKARGHGLYADAAVRRVEREYFELVRHPPIEELRRKQAGRVAEAVIKEGQERLLVESEGIRIRNEQVTHPLNASNWHRMSASPNSLGVLFGPHVQFACNFVNNQPLPKSKPLHSRPWNDRITPHARKRPAILKSLSKHILGKSRRRSSTEESKKQQVPLEKNEDTIQKPMYSDKLKRSEPICTSQDERSQEGKPQANSDSFFNSAMREYDVIKCILVREDILKSLENIVQSHEQEKKKLRKKHKVAGEYDPIALVACSAASGILEAAQSASELFSSLEDLHHIGTLLVDTILRWRRARNRELQFQDLHKNLAGRRKIKQLSTFCERVHTTTHLHDYSAFNFTYQGYNYLAKMANDLDFVDPLFQMCKPLLHPESRLCTIESLRMNPLVLNLSMAELDSRIQTSHVISKCQESELWRALNPASSPSQVQHFQAALVILREQRAFCASENMLESHGDHSKRLGRNQESPELALELFNEKEDPDSFEARQKRQNTRLHYVPVGSDIYRRKARIAALVAAEQQAKVIEDSLLREHSATRIQALMRGFQVRLSMRRHEKRVFACTRMQTIFRGRLARAAFRDLLYTLNNSASIAPVKLWVGSAETAALRIQTFARKVLARWLVQRVREYTRAVTLGAWWRCLWQRKQYIRYLSARAIQCAARSALARASLARRRLAERKRVAALLYQCAFRCWRARLRLIFLRRHRAATVLQRHMRGMLKRWWIKQYYASRRIQVIARQYLAIRAVRIHRRRVRAARHIQLWLRYRRAEYTELSVKWLARWRLEQTSVGRRSLLRHSKGARYMDLSALYDQRQRLLRILEMVERTATAKVALKRLNNKISVEISRGKQPRVNLASKRDASDSVADSESQSESDMVREEKVSLQIIALFKVRKHYEHILHLTKHLGPQEIKQKKIETRSEIAILNEKRKCIERLALAMLKARELRRRTQIAVNKNLVDVIHVDRAVDLTSFTPEYARAAKRRRRLEFLEREERLSEITVRAALRESQWVYAVALRKMDKEQAKTKKTVRLEESRSCGVQIGQFVKGAAVKKAAVRRARAAIEARLRQELGERQACMEAEDRYSQVLRPYLAKASGDQVDKVCRAFRAMTRRETLKVSQVQRLVFDLGVGVIPRATLRKKGYVFDLPQLLAWYFCQAPVDKVEMGVKSKKVTRKAKHAIWVSAMYCGLKADQTARRALDKITGSKPVL